MKDIFVSSPGLKTLYVRISNVLLGLHLLKMKEIRTFFSDFPQRHQGSSGRLPYYMKFSRHKKNREIKVTRKLRDSYYVHNQERPSLLPLKRLQITFFTFLINFQCKWMLWSIDSRTIIHLQA